MTKYVLKCIFGSLIVSVCTLHELSQNFKMLIIVSKISENVSFLDQTIKSHLRPNGQRSEIVKQGKKSSSKLHETNNTATNSSIDLDILSMQSQRDATNALALNSCFFPYHGIM